VGGYNATLYQTTANESISLAVVSFVYLYYFSDSYSKGIYSRDSYYKPLIWDMVAGLFWIESKGEHKGCNEAIDDNKG